MRLRQDHKIVIALIQVACIAVAFFVLNGVLAFSLYLISEISLAELGDFFLGLWSGEGVAVVLYHAFRKSKGKIWRLLNEQRDSEIVSEAHLKELMKLLRT
ncbi:MAG: hypothetical protein ACRDFB_01630 [Rhabdochlamydiaceae bacterium]